MNFEERVDLRAVRWILEQFDEDFMKLNIPVEEQERFKYQYNNIKKILLHYDKFNGINKTIYIKSDKDPKNILRDYASLSIQGLPTYFRGLICNGLMTDIDMVNCHPMIILNLCKKYNVTHKYLEQYCNERKELIANGSANKIKVIESINKHTILKNTTPFMTKLDAEIKNIQREFMDIPDFSLQLELAKDACSKKKDYKRHNIAGTFMSNVATSYEVQILHSIIPLIQRKSLEISVLMYDGFMIYGNAPDGLMEELSLFVKDNYGFDIAFTTKPLETGNLMIPPNWSEPDRKSNYNILKHKYETDYCLAFIKSISSFSYKINGKILFFKQHEMKLELQPIKVATMYKMGHFVAKPLVDKCFFDEWINDAERQTYDDVDIIPHDRKCPSNILNLWTGFYAERITDYQKVDISFFLTHIKIMCNHNDKYYEFVVNWIANLLQYPSSTSLLINFFTDDGGTGKGSLVDIIKCIIGKDKVLFVDDLSRLFGRFNDGLKGIVLCHLDEMSAKDLNPYYERLKAFITSDTLNIETKGVKAFTVANTVKYISTTQHAQAFKIKNGDRRIWTVESSEELKDNTEYFNKFRELLLDDNVIRSLYDFFMTHKVKKQLTKQDYPETKLMEEAKVLNRDPIEDFIIDFSSNDEVTSKDLYSSYKQYIQSSGLEFTVSLRQFQMKFARLMNKHSFTVRQDENRINQYLKKVMKKG
jgi:hypothetical protein